MRGKESRVRGKSAVSSDLRLTTYDLQLNLWVFCFDLGDGDEAFLG
ncbi:MAG: hypothetical protein CLLPBCKN_002600 [Chroococcidiopsis cubana SAG 39.79]|nr:hypothetical protein [Chroococcidiopsis cubana SAG 39.79]